MARSQLSHARLTIICARFSRYTSLYPVISNY